MSWVGLIMMAVAETRRLIRAASATAWVLLQVRLCLLLVVVVVKVMVVVVWLLLLLVLLDRGGSSGGRCRSLGIVGRQ